jgi:hypothetical protein
MNKIKKIDIIRILSVLLFATYLIFNGVNIEFGKFRLHINKLSIDDIYSYKS